mgnify:CR=1 FL=1
MDAIKEQRQEIQEQIQENEKKASEIRVTMDKSQTQVDAEKGQ